MLRQIRIMNFQSIEDLTYNFSEGLNVIVAANNAGKSILNKIIEVLVNFKTISTEDIELYITFGKPKSDLFISDEENSYWVEIYPKMINYYVFENSKFVYVGNELPLGLIKALGLLICDGGFVGNLITSNHSKLLVDSSASINNQILSLIARDDNAEDILEQCEERSAVMRSNIRNLRINRDSVAKELSAIHVEDTTYKEEALKRVFNLTLFVEELIGVDELASSLRSDISKISNLDGVIDLCTQLENLEYKFMNYIDTKPVKNLDKDIRVASELEDVIAKLDLLEYKKNMMTDFKTINVTPNVIGLANKLESLYVSLSKVTDTKLIDPSNLKVCEELESLLEGMDSFTKVISDGESLKDEATKLKEEIDSYGGEVYDCPIYGTIKLVNEECIRDYN